MITLHTISIAAQPEETPASRLAEYRAPGQQWRQKAICGATRPEEDLWYSDHILDRIYAATICAECPVKTQCYQAAIDRRERWGIWGGVDFNPSHRNRTPAYCKAGHLMVDDMYPLTNGWVRCGICNRRNDERPAVPCPNCGDSFVPHGNQIYCTPTCTKSMWDRKRRKKAKEAA